MARQEITRPDVIAFCKKYENDPQKVEFMIKIDKSYPDEELLIVSRDQEARLPLKLLGSWIIPVLNWIHQVEHLRNNRPKSGE